MTFQTVVLTIAAIALIISLVVIGVLIKSAKGNATFPPEVGKCPDYLKATLSGTNGITCTNTHGLGKCGSSFQPTAGNSVSSIITNCNAAKNCGLTWDGITNGQDRDTQSPYC